MRKMKKILLAVISLLPVLTYGQSMKIDPKQIMPGANGNVIITRNGVNTLDNINWADINNIPTDLEHTTNKIDGLGANLDATHYVSGKAIDGWGFIWRGSFNTIDIDATYKSGWYRLQPGGTISGTLPADYNTANVSTLTVYSPGAGAATTIHEYQTLTQADGLSWWRHADVSGNWSAWKQYADRNWVLSQIPGAQTLSISGDDLSISNGNTVTVPNLGNSDINLPTARNIKTTNGQLNIQNSSGKGLIVGPGATILTEGGGNGVVLSTTGLTGTKIATFPNKTGTLAMTSDIPAQVNITGSGGTTVSGTYPNINISSAAVPTVNDATLTMSTGAGLTGSQTFTANSATNKTFTVGLSPATATTIGGVELASNTVQSVAANSVSATSGRTYGVQLNSAGQAVVNVPWTDNNTTYSGSTSINLSGTSFQRAALTGDVTASANSNSTTISNSAVTFPKIQNIPTQTLMGRYASGSGNVQSITLGSNLSLNGSGVLSADNMIQTLGISGQTLSISGGNSVTLPTPSTPNLQQVTDIGAATTNRISAPSLKLGMKHIIGNGYQNYSNILIATDIPSTTNTMIELDIKGTQYNVNPIDAQLITYQYISDNAFVNSKYISNGHPASIDIFNYNGYVYLHFSASTNNTYYFELRAHNYNSGTNYNITSITDAAVPGSGVTRFLNVNGKKKIIEGDNNSLLNNDAGYLTSSTITIPTLDQVATAGNYTSGSISIGAPMSSYWQGASGNVHRWLQLGAGAGMLTNNSGPYILFLSNAFYYNNGSTNYKVALSSTTKPSYCQFVDGGFRMRTHAAAAVGTIIPDASFTQVFGLYENEIQFNALIGTGQRMMVANADGTVTTSALPSSLTLEDVLTNGNEDGGVGIHFTGASGAQTDVGYFGNPDFKFNSNTGINVISNGALALGSTSDFVSINGAIGTSINSPKIELAGNIRKGYKYLSANYTIPTDDPYSIYYYSSAITITLPTPSSANDRAIINLVGRSAVSATISPGYYPYSSSTLSTAAKTVKIQCANIGGTWGWYQIGGVN